MEKRTFIETPMFTKKWYELGLTDDDLCILQNQLLENPKLGDTISGTGGIRKVRVQCNGHGKRGGARVIYVDIEVSETIYMLNVYAKNEKTDLPPQEKKALRAVVEDLKSRKGGQNP